VFSAFRALERSTIAVSGKFTAAGPSVRSHLLRHDVSRAARAVALTDVNIAPQALS